MSGPIHPQAIPIELRELPVRLDAHVWVPALLLIAIGVVMVGSASFAVAEQRGLAGTYYLGRHLMFLAAGLVLVVLAMRWQLWRIEALAPLALPLAIVALLLVFVPGLGVRINGALRWINVGVSNFQVAELARMMFIVFLASYLVRRSEQIQTSLWGVAKPLALVGVLLVLLLLQPDFGGAMLLLAIVFGMLFLGGAPIHWLALVVALAIPPIIGLAMAEPYRFERLVAFLDPWARATDEGYQLTQAQIAISRGEVGGVGIGQSIQKLFYLPEAHTDFVLAVYAEETGFLGLLLVITLYGWLVGRAFQIGLRAAELGQHFASQLAFGIGLALGIQSLISIGVNVGMLPTKGLTLPLISSGGSSVLMTLLALGLLLRISLEQQARAHRGPPRPVARTEAW